uniref:Disease resistance R13L4/SHOC-2-like LRR domain-containing protein n=1 Tax=Fagus sylvatica TaxID=28930 RepID=A0A2N9FQ53_FAGSY
MEDKECCSWDGVECDKTTGHVIGLDLGCSWLFGPIHSNSSLFFLRHLRRLNLAGNDFNHSLLPSEFGKFKSLTHLNLSYSGFSGQIPYEISQLSSLVSLDLAFNWQLIEMPVWKRVVDNLTQLRELVLDYTNMYSIRPYSLMNLSSYLTTLSLIGCSLQGKLEDNILCLPSLQTLNLGWNWQLEGSLPMSNWSSSLKFLDLSYTSLSGELPDSIGYLKSLKYLYLRSCNFMGSIPASLGNLTQITYLYLSYNNFTGSIPASLGNLTQITYLDLSNNNFSGVLSSSLLNMPMLSELHLEHNQLVGPLPNSVSGLLNLTLLYLNSNFLNGTLPSWLFSLPSLVTLLLVDNQLSGEIGEFKSNSLEYLDLSGNPKTKFPFPNLRILDLSTNMFSGPLPGKYFKYLKAMTNVEEGGVKLYYMGEEYYQDSLKVTIKGQYIELERIQTFLTTIDFSKNSFKGEIPKIIGRLKSLKGLNFSHNNLTGYIPSSFGNLTNLEWLDLSSNKLTGEIPTQLVDLPWLEVLNLSQNQLTGHIPTGKQFNTFGNDSYTGNLGIMWISIVKNMQQP